MKKSKLCALITTVIFVICLFTSQFCITSYAADPITDEKRAQYQEIIKEVAYSYFRQGTQIQYDQTAKPPRRNLMVSPEDATSQRTIYLDCSSYMDSVYYEAFGIHLIRSGAGTWSIKTANMLNAARDYPTRRENEGYWTQEDDFAGKTTEEIQEILDEVYANLQVGDVIVYEKAAGGGHTVMYIGDGLILHCTGSTGTSSPNPPSKYYDKSGVTEYTKGAVLCDPAAPFFTDSTQTRWLGNMARFCVIRPFDRTDIEVTPTQKSVNRLSIKGLAMEKTASVHPDNCVDTNDEITYTITLNNTSTTALTDITLTDAVPAGTQFVSGDVTNTSGILTWNGDIAAETTATVSYTVKVTSTSAGQIITNGSTEVNGVSLNTIEHTVAGYGAQQRAQIAAKAKEYVTEGRTFRDGASLVMSAYKDSIGANAFGFTDDGTNISSYSTADELLTEVIDSANFTCHTQTEISGMLVPHLFGGIDITYNSKAVLDGERRSNISIDQLAIGDVVLAEYSKGELVYMYVGDSQFVCLDDEGKATLITTEEGYYLYETASGSAYYRTYEGNKLVSLIAYDRFAVLRPSMKPDSSEVSVTGIEITTPPTKLVYDSGDKIDTTGMVVTATMSDGSTRKVTNFALSKDTISYPETSVDVYFGPFSATLSGLEAKLTTFKISGLKDAPLNTDIQVEGIYVGIGSTSNATNTIADFRPLLMLKDENTNDTIALSLEASMYARTGTAATNHVYNPNGVTKGDKLKLTVQIKTGDPNYTGNSGRIYLTLVDSTITSFEDFVTSSGNSTKYDLSKAIVISTWEDMQKYYTSDNDLPFYSLVVFTGSHYMRANSSKYAYYIHKNAGYSAAADSKPDGSKNIGFRRYVVNTNVQTNWVANNLFGTTSIGTSGIGSNVSKDIYALYVGNSSSFFYHTILDSSWITDNKCYIESVSEDNTTVNLIANAPGNYTMYFADYEDGKLQECYPVDITAVAAGKMTADIPEDFVISAGDKILFWQSRRDGITPLSTAWVFE